MANIMLTHAFGQQEVLFHQDYARAQVRSRYIEIFLGSELPLYSPDSSNSAPSDYFLHRRCSVERDLSSMMISLLEQSAILMFPRSP